MQASIEHAYVSTHSRPKAAGIDVYRYVRQLDGFNTQPPEGGWFVELEEPVEPTVVSTHSRPKAAGRARRFRTYTLDSFNTQPPEGGWCLSQKPCSVRFRSPDFAKLPRKA